MYKKHVLIFTVVVLTTNIAQSQEFSKHTLGVRPEAIIFHFNDHGDDDDEWNGDSGGISISYQLGIGSKNRLEFDLGVLVVGDKGIPFILPTFVGIYQHMFPLYNNFNWYLGIGVGVPLGLIANGGIEYSPKFPIQISLDIRSGTLFTKPDSNSSSIYSHTGFGLGIRYRF